MNQDRSLAYAPFLPAAALDDASIARHPRLGKIMAAALVTQPIAA